MRVDNFSTINRKGRLVNRLSTASVDNVKDDREQKINVELYQLQTLRDRALQLTDSGPILRAIQQRREQLIQEKADLLRAQT